MEDEKFNLEYVCQTCHKKFPKKTADVPAGMHVLHRFPTAGFLLEPFVEGSRALLERVTKRVISNLSPFTKLNDQSVQPVGESHMRRFADPILTECANFTNNIAPVSDDAAEY